MEHENLHHALLNMEKWLMIMRQKLESFCSPSGHWSVEGRQREAEVGVGLFFFSRLRGGVELYLGTCISTSRSMVMRCHRVTLFFCGSV